MRTGSSATPTSNRLRRLRRGRRDAGGRRPHRLRRGDRCDVDQRGFDHTCAVFVGGTVRCWGTNGDGRLGYGAAPVAVTDPASVGPISLGGQLPTWTRAGPIAPRRAHLREARRRNRPLLGLEPERAARLRQHPDPSATTRRPLRRVPSTLARASRLPSSASGGNTTARCSTPET